MSSQCGETVIDLLPVSERSRDGYRAAISLSSNSSRPFSRVWAFRISDVIRGSWSLLGGAGGIY